MLWLAPGPSRSARLHQMFRCSSLQSPDQHKTCEKSWETFGTKLKFPDFNLTINVMFAQLIQAIAHRKTESDRYYLFQEHTINTIETFERGEVT